MQLAMRAGEGEQTTGNEDPCIAGMSEDIRCVCREFDIRVVFKTGWTLRSMLTSHGQGYTTPR